MSAIESSVDMFYKICFLAETKIDEHFKHVDNLPDKSQAANLHVADVADYISAQIKSIRQQECVSSLYLYIKNRDDLEVRPGKHGGICRIGEKRGREIPMTPKECALQHYEVVKEYAFFVIDDSFAKAEAFAKERGFSTDVKLNFQELCALIADKLDIKQYAVYHCMKAYIEEERSDLVIDLGRYGGLRRKKATAA